MAKNESADKKKFTVFFKYVPGKHSHTLSADNEEEAINLFYAAFGIENVTVVRVEDTKEAKVAKRAAKLKKLKATPEELRKVADYIEKNLKKK